MEAASLLALFRFVIFWGEHAVVGPYSIMTQIDDAFAVQTANASSIYVDGWEYVIRIGVVCCAVCPMKADTILIRYTIVSTARNVVTLSRWMEDSGNVLDGGLVSRPQRSCNGRQRTGRSAQCAGRGA